MEGLRTATPIVAPPTGIIPNADVSAIYYVVNKNYRDPYVMSYNLTVQQELGRNFVLDAAYVGNQGRQIPAGYNLNADRSAPGAGAPGQPLYGITGGVNNSIYRVATQTCSGSAPTPTTTLYRFA